MPYLAALLGYRPIHAIGPVSQRALAGQWIGRCAPRAPLQRSRRSPTAPLAGLRGRSNSSSCSRIRSIRNHARPQVHGALDMRRARRLEDLGSGFDSAHYTVDVGRIARREGLHNIANVGLYLWRLRPGPGRATARCGSARGATPAIPSGSTPTASTRR